MTLVLDASVAMKLVYREGGTAEAQTLLARPDERIAPDWMLAEIANGLTNKVRYEKFEPARAQASFAAMSSFVDRFVAVQPLLSRAMDLALALSHPLYDCIYLQVAIEEGGRVVTADDGFAKSARQGGYADRVEHLTWTK